MKPRILHVVENDYFPRDARVYNEAKAAVDSGLFSVVVLAPRQKRQRVFDIVDGMRCYRFPHFEADSTLGLLVEYSIAAFWVSLAIPLIVSVHGVRLIHVANPPDFVIPLTSWLRLFGIKFVFDMHDLSVESLEAKFPTEQGILLNIVKRLLRMLEYLSIYVSSAVIATNGSIKEYVKGGHKAKNVQIVRNSNPRRYTSIDEIPKNHHGALALCYFGVISSDRASGYENLVALARCLRSQSVAFSFEVIGAGSGLPPLKSLVAQEGLEQSFAFHGFLPLEASFGKIIHCDFGIVPWPNVLKNNLHTSMKVMDYMCCGVPACSLNLREQLYSTGGVGIHTDTFEEMAAEMARVFSRRNEYEELRRNTLQRFNDILCWENQARNLLAVYRALFNHA